MTLSVRRIVVLYSGGLDSSVLLYSLHADGQECWPLSIVYGQRHARETVAAKRVCELKSEALMHRWRLLNLKTLRHVLKSALIDSPQGIPEGSYTSETQAQTVVPNRNMILLSVAVGYAQSIGADSVAYAAHMNDKVVYPDCRPGFVSAMARSIKESTEGQIELLAPYVNYTKADLVKFGTTLRVPFSATYSCYNGRRKHCGLCSTCIERKEAFQVAEVEDPTEYEA